MPQTIIIDHPIAVTTQETPGELRWVKKWGESAMTLVLQQRFVVTTFEEGRTVFQRNVWRDVPTANQSDE